MYLHSSTLAVSHTCIDSNLQTKFSPSQTILLTNFLTHKRVDTYGLNTALLSDVTSSLKPILMLSWTDGWSVGRSVPPSIKIRRFSWSQSSGDRSTDRNKDEGRKKREEQEEDSWSAISRCLCPSVSKDEQTQPWNVWAILSMFFLFLTVVQWWKFN